MIYQLGDQIPLSVRTVSSTGVPTEPDAAPRAIVYSSAGIVDSVELPIDDRKNVTGYFRYLYPLSSKYSAGLHTIQLLWKVSGTVYSEIMSFEIAAGGDASGAGIALEYFRAPAASYVLYQTDQGELKKKKNPRVEV